MVPGLAAGEGNSSSDFVLLGDQPHDGLDDPLGFDLVVGDLASLILASRVSTPFTLGIDAPWGMGKSTLMARLRRRLSAEEGITTVQFNAWTADDGGVLEGLVKTVLNELDAKVLRRALRNEKLMSGLRVAASVAGGLVGVGNVVDALWSRVADDPRARNELRGLVDQAVSAWRNEQPELAGDRMLCVFVDDLDRCSPEGVLEVFEAMKLYLDVPGIVFVIGYDQDIVSDLVLRKKGYSEAIKSRDYLEKFIQIVYRVPRPVAEQSGALVESLLATSGTADLFGATERELVIEGSQSNPRRIKRFVNGFVLAYGLDARWRKFAPQSLVRVQLLQMYFQDFAKLLESRSERDPVDEFLEYRSAHDVLRRHDQSADAWSQVVKALNSHGLAAPDREEVRDFDLLLHQLEENVPESFPPLVGRDDFTSLVKSVTAAEEWPQLRMALAEGALALVAADQIAEEQEPQGGRESFEGLRVLWADDEPARNAALARRLEAEGASVVLAHNATEMESALSRRVFDVLISDIARPDSTEAGLEAIERLKDERFRLPRVVFYTLRPTAARRRRAAVLDAPLTADPDELLAILEEVAQTRLRDRFDPASVGARLSRAALPSAPRTPPR